MSRIPFVARAAFCLFLCFGFTLVATGSAYAVDAKLVAAAKKEGEVTWYTTLIVKQVVRPLVAGFEKKYGIRVRYSRANATSTAIKILNEARANRIVASVFDGTSTEPPLEKAGLVAKWTPEAAKMYPPEYRDKDGYWTAANLYFLTPGYNTNLVKPGDVPKTYQDLLDPKWKGKIVWNASSTSSGPGFIGNVLRTMGQKKGMTYLDKLSQQKIVNMEASARKVLDQVIAGEYPLALNIFNHHTVISAAKGAPVSWIPMSPVMSLVSTVALLKDAPQPNAGKLLIEFILSKEGQKIFQKANYLPALPSVPAKTPTLKPKEGGFTANVFTPKEIADNLPKWKKIFNEKFR